MSKASNSRGRYVPSTGFFSSEGATAAVPAAAPSSQKQRKKRPASVLEDNLTLGCLNGVAIWESRDLRPAAPEKPKESWGLVKPWDEERTPKEKSLAGKVVDNQEIVPCDSANQMSDHPSPSKVPAGDAAAASAEKEPCSQPQPLHYVASPQKAKTRRTRQPSTSQEPKPKKARATAKAKAKSKAKAQKGQEEDAPPQVAFGLNVIRQDMKRGRWEQASAGCSSQTSRQMKRYYDKNGRTKKSSAYRHRNLREQALKNHTLAASQEAVKKAEAFSPAVTKEMIAGLQEAIGESGLGDIADARPSDTFHGCDPSSSSTAPPPGAEDLDDDHLLKVLRKTFGHKAFRPGQREAVASVLAGQNTLLLLATGSGKSLCYQLPAYLLREEGLTLVVSPLISLMTDQLQRLPKCLRGAVASSHQTRDELRQVMRAVRARLVDVLFISPERLSMWAFDGCGLPPVALACIDEAHCVSEWSHNFRPDYLRLHEFLVGSLGAKRLLALTATATRPTVQSICNILNITIAVRSDRSFDVEEILREAAQPRVQRPNLVMDVRHLPDQDCQEQELVRILQNKEHIYFPTIIYVWRKATADRLARLYRTVVHGGIRAYHGGMTREARKAVQDAFMLGLIRVVVATVAFGMGLDKSDIRMVIHFGQPKSIESYIQETGRCARDGEKGKCIALISPKDFVVMRRLESGGGGGGSKVVLVSKLLQMVLNGEGSQCERYELSEAAAAELLTKEPDSESASSTATQDWRPYHVAFEEKEMAKAVGCTTDELHSALAHLAHYAKGRLLLMSKFPTKLKLRFFGTSAEELIEIDPLLRKVLPLAKKCGPVHTIETAKAIAAIGGSPGRLSSSLWEAQGNEFTVEKADYGYMVTVLYPMSEHDISRWADEISMVNARARANSVEKLDAAFIALARAAQAGNDTKAPEDEAPEAFPRELRVDRELVGLIDSYFAALKDPSGVVAGDGAVRHRLLASALGAEFRPSTSTAPQQGTGGGGVPQLAVPDRQAAIKVTTAVVKLLGSPEWPELPCQEVEAQSKAIAQFLAGISTVILPSKKWREHSCWGKCRELADLLSYDTLEDLVSSCLPKVQKALTRQTSAPSSPKSSVGPSQ